MARPFTTEAAFTLATNTSLALVIQEPVPGTMTELLTLMVEVRGAPAAEGGL